MQFLFKILTKYEQKKILIKPIRKIINVLWSTNLYFFIKNRLKSIENGL